MAKHTPKTPPKSLLPNVPSDPAEREKLLRLAQRHGLTLSAFYGQGEIRQAEDAVRTAELLLKQRRDVVRAEEDKVLLLYLSVTTGPLADALSAQPWDESIRATFPAGKGGHPAASDAEIRTALARKANGWYVSCGDYFLHSDSPNGIYLSPSPQRDPQLAVLAGDGLIAEVRRILKIPLSAAKAQAPKPASKPAAAKPTKIRPDKPAGSRGSVDKGKELAALAKTAAAGKTSAGKGAVKPAKAAAAGKQIKALNVSVLGPGRFKINYRQGDSGRSIEVEGRSAMEAAAIAAFKLGMTPGTYAVAYKNCTASSTGQAEAPAPAAAPAPAPDPNARPGRADGYYLFSNGNDWRFERVLGERLADKGRVGSAEAMEVEDAARGLMRVVGINAAEIRILDDGGQLLEGTAADLLNAEAMADGGDPVAAQADAAPAGDAA